MRLTTEQVTELLFRFPLHLGAWRVHRWKVRAPLEWPGRVDDRARAVALAVLRYARVERSAPRSLDDVDGVDWIRTRAHRPHDVVQVHHVDVVVDDDDVAPEVRAGVHGRREMTDLARVSRVALLDAHRVEEARTADLVAPDALDSRDPDRLELRPQQRRPEERPVEGLLVGRLVRRRAEDDRVVAVIERLDLHERLGPRITGVVARPLAERTLDDLLFRIHPALDDDLGIGREREPGDRSFDNAIRLAAHAAGPVVLGQPELDLRRAREEHKRGARRGECDRHALPTPE